jgi:hypothetical protein
VEKEAISVYNVVQREEFQIYSGLITLGDGDYSDARPPFLGRSFLWSIELTKPNLSQLAQSFTPNPWIKG